MHPESQPIRFRKVPIWGLVCAIVAVLSLAVNAFELSSPRATSVSLEVVNSTYPRVQSLSAIAGSLLISAPTNVVSTNSTGAAVAWDQATSALAAGAPALEALGVPHVRRVVQEFEVVAAEIPYLGSPMHGKNFAKAKSFVALAVAILPRKILLNNGAITLGPISQAFSALATRGSFILPSP